MNRFLYVGLITLISIIGFTMYNHHDLGSISIQFASFNFETNLVVFGAAILSALFVGVLFVKIFRLFRSLLNTLFGQRKTRLQRKAHAQLKQGLLEYMEGKFGQAEKTLLNHIHHSENPLLAYMTAANAAHNSGSPERRDNYLREALEASPEAELAIGITQAQLQLEQHQNEQALATLQQLNHHTPGHFFILQLLASTYLTLEDWQKLSQLMPELKKHGQLSTENFLQYEIAITRGQLTNITRNNDPAALQDHWLKISKSLQNRPAIIEHYARCLIELNDTAGAEKILRNYLNSNWHNSTIKLYANVDAPANNKILDVIEKWLKAHPQNIYLLQVAGKTCLNLSLWGKARNYFEACLAVHPLPETCLQLARLLEEKMHDSETAANYYRQGLNLLVGNDKQTPVNTVSQPVLANDETPVLKIVKQ